MRLALSSLLLCAAFLLASASRGVAQGTRAPHLWYPQPAVEWDEALPIGNGRLGAMVFGRVPTERIAINEDTFWSGGPYASTNPEALAYLPEVRRLIREGQYSEAQALAEEKLMGRPVHLQTFQPLGDLILDFEGHDGAEGYRRELDLDAGVASVTYRVGGTRHSRELFSSAPDQVIVVRLAASRASSLSFRAGLVGRHPSEVVAEGQHGLRLSGRYRGDAESPEKHLKESHRLAARWYGDGLAFDVRLQADLEGGRAAVEDGALVVRDASAVTLRLAAATSFRGQDPTAVTAKRIEASRRSFGALLARHQRDHRSLFRRVRLDLGSSERDRIPTDLRLKAVANGASDPALAALYFQFGRYLLMASSRPGTEPANLQGIWNDDLHPAWGSKYTINVNTEMNYWPAEVTNLAECHTPLFDLIEQLREPGRETARVHYGARGFVAHHNTDLWRRTTPVDGARWGLWPFGAAWLSTHLFEHYAFGGDRAFLARVYPTMREAAEFLLDFLVPDAKGRLVTNPSHSPENAFIDAQGRQGVLCVGATMDFGIIRDLFGDVVRASTILGTDEEFRGRIEEALAKLPPYAIGRHGQLQEWMEDFDEAEPGHRHISHLYGLHPGGQITLRGTPDLARAARVSLERRLSHGGGHTGWSRAWIVNHWARLEDGDEAHAHLTALLAKSTRPNLFDSHPPFQIDGNFGGTAGIAEMLLQSHANEVHLLPALPKAWATGRVVGLRARGGFEVDITWKAGRLAGATVRSSLGGPATVRYGERAVRLETRAGGAYFVNGSLALAKTGDEEGE